MKAVILVGGFGTRLRPFTFSQPKPCVPFVNQAIVEHQIAALAEAGVTEIILAVGHMPTLMMDFMKDIEAKYSVKVLFSIEDKPLGTAGPLGLCREKLLEDEKPFFMLNSDVACEFPLVEMLNYHNEHGKEGTILVTPVEDPSKYGLVVANEDGLITQFLEKPAPGTKNLPSNKINAGIYLLNKSVLKRIPTEQVAMSIERQVFPAMVVDADVHAMILPGYWMDVGQPKDFLTGTHLHLAMLARRKPETLLKQAGIVGNVVADASATIGSDCSIGPDVVIGPNCVVGNGVRLAHCTLMAGTKVDSFATVKSSIVGWGSTIHKWAHVEKCFLGEDVEVGQEVILHEAVVCPHKGFKEHSLEKGVFM
jgi:mannose-1-phosphate guanylyltransferase